MTTRFISDLHLSEARPDITRLFFDFLQTEARQSDALYILGDLFDAWIGDDDETPFHLSVMHALHQLTSAGVPVFFIAGNRDFLIGQRFSRKTRVQILPEPSVADLYGTPTLLMHGDTLCTLDTGYQRFRKLIRTPWLLSLLTRLPLSWRRAIAGALRKRSKTHKTPDAEQLRRMDVTDQAVVTAMKQAGVTRLIHGHTHRPGVHQHTLGHTRVAERIVLGDWYEQGSILDISQTGYTLRSESLPVNG